MFIKTRNSWVAKSLMSHTFFVKFPGFKHASQENYFTYRLHTVFSDETSFVKFFQYSEEAIS